MINFKHSIARGIVLAIMLLVASSALAQPDITSMQDGLWNAASTWSVGAPPNPDAANTTSITINHQVTIPNGSNFDLDQLTIGTGGRLIIESGSIITILNNTDPDIAITGTGQLSVSGTLRFSNGVTFTGLTAANTNFLSGSIYQHLYTSVASSLPLATWNPGSTLRVTGWTGTGPVHASWAQNFGNVDVSLNVAGVLQFNGLLTSIAGSLTFNNINVNPLTIQLSTSQSPVINISGDITINGNTLLIISSTVFPTISNPSISIGGSFDYNSTRGSLSSLFGPGNPSMSIQGDLNLNCGISTGGVNIGSNSSTVVVNLYGDLNLVKGIIQRNNTGGTTAINFNKSGTSQFNRNTLSTTMVGPVNLTVSSNTQLNLGTSIIGGTGTFTLNGILGIGSVAPTGAIPNHMVISGKTYNPGSKIIYNGASAQVANGHPSAVGVNTEINNSSGVSITSGAVTMGGNLTVQSGNLTVAGTNPSLAVNGALTLENTGGNLIVGNNASLTLNGAVLPNSKNITTTSTSNLTINGSGSFGIFPFPAGSQSIQNLTLNRSSSGSVEFTNDLTILGTVTLTQGNLVFNNRLDLRGTFNASAGRLKASNSPALEISSSANVGTLLFDPSNSGNVLSSLIMSGTGLAALGSPVSLTTNLDLLNGNLVNTAGISVSNGLVVTRNSNASLTGRLSAALGDVYNVVYNGSEFNTGDELPLEVNNTLLRNLTINGGPVNLFQNITINGDMIFNSGSLAGGQYLINMKGSQWLLNGGVFNPQLSNVVFSMNTIIGGLSIPTFAGLELEPSANVTISSSDLFISGNLLVNTGAISNIASKNIKLNGDVFQDVSVNNSLIRNIEINKNDGEVTLSSAMQLTGILDILSNTILNSNGNLTLVSTSDGPEGNASIASLGAAVISGNVTVQRYMSVEGRIYRYLSSPVTNATVAGWMDDFPVTGTFANPTTLFPEITDIVSTSPSLFFYNETLSGELSSGWTSYPASGLASENPIIPGVGYAAFIRQATAPTPTTWELTGPINQGTIDFVINYTNTGNLEADGWNLIGNPYPSTINWSDQASWNSFNIGNVIAIRNNGLDASNNNFMYSDDQGFPNPGYIATGQAFWVRAVGDAPLLSINETAKLNQTGIFYRESGWDFDYLEVTLAQGSKSDKAYIRQRNGAQKKLDRFDGPKLQNDFFSLSVVSADAADLAISAVDKFSCGDVIPLTLRFPLNSQGNFITQPMGEYVLIIQKGGLLSMNVALFDTFMGTTSIVTQSTSYTFLISEDPQSYNPDRFELRLVEIPIEMSFQFGSDEIQCGETSRNMILSGSQPGVDYTLFINGNESLLNISGNGLPLTFLIDNTYLLPGMNEVSLRVKNSCNAFQYPTNAIIDFDPIYEVMDVAASQVCNEGISTLTATGAPAGSIYNWYLLEDGNQVLQNEHGAIFNTSPTNKEQIYYVGITNKSGCEGERIPINVKVVTFEPALISFIEPDSLVSNYSCGNTWFLNGERLPDEDQSIKMSLSGLYRLEIKIKECITFAEKSFVITSAKDISRGLSVYPNPVIDRFMISMNEQDWVEEVSVLSSTGQEVMLLNEVNLNQPQKEIDISHLPSGIYYIVIKTNKEIREIKIIKR